MDISDESSVSAGFAAAGEQGYAVDVVVANAGVQLFGQDAMIADRSARIFGGGADPLAIEISGLVRQTVSRRRRRQWPTGRYLGSG